MCSITQMHTFDELTILFLFQQTFLSFQTKAEQNDHKYIIIYPFYTFRNQNKYSK